MDRILELNNVLDEEIKFCEKFEELLLAKKDVLIHSKPMMLKEFDDKIYEAQKKLAQLTESRRNITQKFGNENTKLSDIIKQISNPTEAKQLEEKRKKIQLFAEKIQITNKVINSLIEHSLKLIDGSIFTIAKAIAKTQNKGDYYNLYGKKEKQEVATISAIIEEA